MRSRRALFVVAALLAALTREAGADITHLKSSSQVETEKGSKLTLPPGYFLDEETWLERDLEMRRLQALETSLKVENKSLRDSAAEKPWGAIVVGGAIGFVAGAVVILAVK